MNKYKVCCKKCNDYNQDSVDVAVKSLIDELGGIECYVKPGQNVVLKPNLIGKYSEDRSATTHPSVLFSVANLCFSAGAASVTIADSPGGLYNKNFLSGVYKGTGIAKKFEGTNVILNNNFNSSYMKLQRGDVTRTFDIIEVLQQADVIINICKLKSHTFTGLSCATKNMFGAIPGLVKAQFHANFSKLDDFCDMLVDLYELLAPKISLNIVDGIIAMQGNGPTAGTPYPAKVLIAGQNPYAVDYKCLQIIGDKPDRSPIILAAKRKKVFFGIDEIEIAGDNVETLKNFKVLNVGGEDVASKDMPKLLRKLAFYMFVRRPKIVKKKCVACNKCIDHCPVQAMVIKNGAAKIDYKKCIKCFCCQELCPSHIIKVKTPLFAKMINKK